MYLVHFIPNSSTFWNATKARPCINKPSTKVSRTWQWVRVQRQRVLTHGVCGRERGTRTPPHPIDFRDFGDDGMCRGVGGSGAQRLRQVRHGHNAQFNFIAFIHGISSPSLLLNAECFSLKSAVLPFRRHFHLFFISWGFAHKRLTCMYFTAADIITLSSPSTQY